MLKETFRLFLSWVIIGVYWLLSRTWRFKHLGLKGKNRLESPHIYAHWHGDELLMVGVCVGWGMAVMASRSKDGLLMKRVLTGLGYRVTRGSSSRGGAGGLKGMIDLIETHACDASLAVDGPRGPIYQPKPGILKLSQQTQIPIVPGAAAASKRFVFKRAWNQCYLPYPFAKCVVVYGEPILVSKDCSEEEFEKLRLQLGERLKELKIKAEAEFSRELSFPKIFPSGTH